MNEEISAAIKEQFLANLDPVLARDINRLSRFGKLALDPSGYMASAEEFVSALGDACTVTERELDIDAFDQWYAEFDYTKLFPEYCKTYTDPKLLRKKAFEHWLSIEDTREAPDGTFLDVGCATSPFHALWSHLPENPAETCYQVDLPLPEYGYKPGIHGNVIGSTADAIPLPDASVSRIYSHNALEHFEGGSYVGFFDEAARLLKPGGVIYVCPLFFAAKTFIYVSLAGIYRRLSFPNIPAGIDLVYSDQVGQPYVLQIDAEFLKTKLIDRLGKQMDFELIHYTNESLSRDLGVRFGLKGTKRG